MDDDPTFSYIALNGYYCSRRRHGRHIARAIRAVLDARDEPEVSMRRFAAAL